jgi:hypothetical protein
LKARLVLTLATIHWQQQQRQQQREQQREQREQPSREQPSCGVSENLGFKESLLFTFQLVPLRHGKTQAELLSSNVAGFIYVTEVWAGALGSKMYSSCT